MTVLSLNQSASAATEMFRTFKPGAPALIKTGIPGVDRIMGGMFPGAAGVIGADTGIGKSSLVLAAAMGGSTKDSPIGIISVEDGPDVLGSRSLSLVTGIDSLRIRIKDLSPDDIRRLERGMEALKQQHVQIVYCIGGSREQVAEGIEELAIGGCKLVYVDYIGKIRGSGQDRRNEVGGNFTMIQATAARKDMAAMVVSQVARRADMTAPPRRWHLKESGDLEAEARLVVMLSRDADNIVTGLIDKSTVGGEGRSFRMRRDGYGLREMTDDTQLTEEF